MHDTLLTVDEVASHLKCSKATIWNLLKEQKLRRIKLGTKTTRISADDLERFLTEGQEH